MVKDRKANNSLDNIRGIRSKQEKILEIKTALKFSCDTAKFKQTQAHSASVFPRGQFFSANQRFVGARAKDFWQYGKHSFRKLNKLVEI